MELPLQGEFTEQDVQRAAALSRPRWFATWRLLFSLFLLFPLLWMAARMLPHWADQPSVLAAVVGILLPIVLYLLLAAVLLYFLWVQPVRAISKLAGSPLFQGTFSGRATNDVLELSSESVQSRVRWDAFVHRKALDDMVLLYQNDTTFSIVPRRFSASDEDWTRFQEHVRAVVPEKEESRGSTLRWAVYGIGILVILFALLSLLLGGGR
jgi:hypothetical protein